MKNHTRRFAIFGMLSAAFALPLYIPAKNTFINPARDISYSEFDTLLKQNKLQEITIEEDTLYMVGKDGRRYSTRIPGMVDQQALFERMMQSDAHVKAENSKFIANTLNAGLSVFFASYAFEEAKKRRHYARHDKTATPDKISLQMTAYHEAGHALSAILKPCGHRLNYATINIAEGMLGHVDMDDSDIHTKQTLTTYKNSLIMLMAGRAAEIVKFGKNHIGGGAIGDIQTATDTAREMVTELGMSEKLGPVCYERSSLLSRIFRLNVPTPETARQIEQETKRFVEEALAEAIKLLTENREKLDTLAQALLDKKHIARDEIFEIVGIEKAKPEIQPEADN